VSGNVRELFAYCLFALGQGAESYLQFLPLTPNVVQLCLEAGQATLVPFQIADVRIQATPTGQPALFAYPSDGPMTGSKPS